MSDKTLLKTLLNQQEIIESVSYNLIRAKVDIECFLEFNKKHYISSALKEINNSIAKTKEIEK